eukprot:2099788-Rhodomonas_salina.1
MEARSTSSANCTPRPRSAQTKTGHDDTASKALHNRQPTVDHVASSREFRAPTRRRRTREKGGQGEKRTRGEGGEPESDLHVLGLDLEDLMASILVGSHDLNLSAPAPHFTSENRSCFPFSFVSFFFPLFFGNLAFENASPRAVLSPRR